MAPDRQVVVLRTGNEIRVALVEAGAARSLGDSRAIRPSARCSSRKPSETGSSSSRGCTRTQTTSSLRSFSVRAESSSGWHRVRRLGRDRAAIAVQARRIVAVPAGLDAGERLRRPLRPGGELMSVRARLVLLFTIAFALGAAGTAGAYHTHFVEWNCTTNTPTTTPFITRDGAMQVALVARYEGYQWAGGCWDDDNRDDSPGDPKENPYTGGEGAGLLGLHVQGMEGIAESERRGLLPVVATTQRPRPVYGCGIQRRRRRPERDAVQNGRVQNGRLGKPVPYRNDLREKCGRL